MSRGRRRSGSPYWDWVAKKFPADDTGRMLEPKEANPSQLEEQEPSEPSPELQAAIKVIEHGGLKVLTDRQSQLFELVVKRGFTVGRAARVLGISRQTAAAHLKAAGKKLREKCEKQLRKNHDSTPI